MGKALIIGAGGVASVAVHKCCQNSEVFEEICIASRTKSKCDALKEKLDGGKTKITTAQVDANNVDELIALINKEKPDVVLNLALPYQDLTIMDACLATKTHYVDTANYEPEDTAKFEYTARGSYLLHQSARSLQRRCHRYRCAWIRNPADVCCRPCRFGIARI